MPAYSPARRAFQCELKQAAADPAPSEAPPAQSLRWTGRLTDPSSSRKRRSESATAHPAKHRRPGHPSTIETEVNDRNSKSHELATHDLQQAPVHPHDPTERVDIRQQTPAPFADSTAYSLNEDLIRSRLQDLASQVKSVASEWSLMTVSDPDAPAHFNLHAGVKLEELYHTVLGPGLVAKRMAAVVKHITTADLTAALISAFIWSAIFGVKPLLSATVHTAEVRGILGEVRHAVEQELRRSSTCDSAERKDGYTDA